jgi:epoxyqueuosine reductase
MRSWSMPTSTARCGASTPWGCYQGCATFLAPDDPCDHGAVHPAPHTELATEDLLAIGRAAGLDAVGVAAAVTFDSTRRDLEERRAAGLHGGMAFTYRNPARSTDPGRILDGARSIVVGARAYLIERADEPDPGEPSPPRARVARYAWTDHYGALGVSLGVVADTLIDAGWRARVVLDDNALVDREAAYRAGLGWYGKNANLLLPGRGSWFVLGSVVTDAPLEPSAGPEPDGCGTCTRCLDGCPTGAIVAPGVVDARRCLAWLVQAPGSFPPEHRVALGDRIYGCDDCQEVCPPNRLSSRRGDAARAESEDVDALVDLLQLLGSDDEALLARHGRWYIARRDPVHLRRNALVALGNIGDPSDPRVVDAIAEALRHEEPLVRAHAVWAARRLGLDDLLAAATGLSDDLMVAGELALTVESRFGTT